MTAPAAAGQSMRALSSPDRREIAVGPAGIPDAYGTALRQLAAAPAGFWGGTYTAKTGELVRVFSSNSYTVDQAKNQKWADFLASLVHGPELQLATLVLAPLPQLQQICGGPGILGCYGGDTILAPGEDTPSISSEAIITHEYGHHVAAHANNAPWKAIDWGTKRWASYEQVCARTNKHQLFPGSEEPPTYQLNPGEGFAETYRVLNERRAGLPETPWQIVDQSLYPDDRALALLQQDIVDPWKPTTATYRGSFAKRGTSTRTFRITAPFDGTLTDALHTARGERLKAIPSQSLLCGDSRTVIVRVTRVRGSGPFTLTVVRP